MLLFMTSFGYVLMISSGIVTYVQQQLLAGGEFFFLVRAWLLLNSVSIFFSF